LIQLDGKNIFIEVKVDSPLDENQLKNHLKSIDDGYLLCITPREEDKKAVNKIGNHALKFITWKEVYRCFENYLSKANGSKAKFLIRQFLDYLESINMAPFTGWNKKDFEAFLNIEDDPERELRLRVKEKMNQYLKELKDILNKEKLFYDLEIHVGNVKKNSNHVWGVLCPPPIKDKVHTPHFNFVIDSNEFAIGVQIEGKYPSKKMENYINLEKEKFLEILGKLEKFELIIRKRINPTGRPRDYHGIDVIKIMMGKDSSMADVEYILKKMKEYRLFEIYCGRSFERDEKILCKEEFLKESAKIMKQLEEYYGFSLGKF